MKSADKEKMGAYLKRLIEERYPSHRKFGKAYLEAIDVQVNDEELRKISNKLSQIINGKKGIQLEDLMVFTDLLGVSCEEIITGGNYFVPVASHMTNYEIAFTDDPRIWKKYMEREDKIFLNSDEYGKTVIEYTLEFKNYKFMKYLMDEGYIWLVDNSEWKNFGYSYGAGTSVKKRDFRDYDTSVPFLLYTQDRIRTQTIALAIENNDLDILDTLLARDNPFLHDAGTFGFAYGLERYYNADLMKAVSESDEKVLDYFSREFEIKDTYGNENTFIYPYMGKLIDIMLKTNRKEVELLIRRSLKHNKETLKKLEIMIRGEYQYVGENYDWLEKESVMEMALRCFRFDNENKIVNYIYHKEKQSSEKIVTNIVYISEKSSAPLINELISEINELYSRISSLGDKSLTKQIINWIESKEW